jgi:hypothetical protein
MQPKNILFFIIVSILFVSTTTSGNDISERLKEVTGTDRVKVVWSRTDNNLFGFPDGNRNFTKNQILVGFDTDKGIEDTILSTARNYQRPLISHDGSRIVFSDVDEGKIYSVEWKENATPVEIGSGVAGCLWYDKSTNKEFVIYLSSSPYNCRLQGRCPIKKMNIDDTTEDDVFFNGNRNNTVNAHWLCVSSDAKVIGDVWGWPNCYNIKMFNTNSNGTILAKAQGCWTSMPFDTSYRLMLLNLSHTGWKIYGPDNSVDSVKTGSINHLKIGSYETNVICATQGMSAENPSEGGYVIVFRANNNLSAITDSVTITTSKNNGFPDVRTLEATATKKFKNTSHKYSFRQHSESGFETYRLDGRKIRLTSKSVSGVYLIKNNTRMGNRIQPIINTKW